MTETQEVLHANAIITDRGYILVESRIDKYKRWIKEAIIGAVIGLAMGYTYGAILAMFGIGPAMLFVAAAAFVAATLL